MKHKFLILLFSYTVPLSLLFSQNDESWKVYDDSDVAIIEITMDPNDLQFMYDNPWSDSMHVAQVHFKNALIDEMVDSVGIRIRGNTSRESGKKSFKLSFNTFIQGGKFYSIEKLNLNGEHNDPSIARSKICWDFFQDIDITSTRAAHAAVFINSKYYGLYISVEHIDENFVTKNFEDDSGNLWKCLFGADLTYISDDPNSYKIGSVENRVYDLKTNRSLDDYKKLADLIDFINNSDNETFRRQIPQKINLLGTLQYFAINVLTGSWDDYWALSNNYYLYHEPSKDIFHIISYDYDNTFGISWFNTDWALVNPYTFGKVVDGPRPLIENLLEVPEFHNLYTHILSFFSKVRFKTSLAGNLINDLKNLITPFAAEDIYRIIDYGFSFDDFNNSFFLNGYTNSHVRYSIQDFINTRYSSLNAQLYYKDALPIIYDLNIQPKYQQPQDSIYINCSAFSNDEIHSIKVELTDFNNNQTVEYEMEFAPELESTNIKKTDLWKCKIGNLGKGFKGEIKFIIEYGNGLLFNYPENGLEIKTSSEVTNEVLLSELMSSNRATIQDNFSEYDDWLEIFNPNDTVVNLSGKYLTDKRDNLTKWQIPEGMIINPNEYKIFWCDEDQEQGENHTNFRLNSNGEFVALVDTDGISLIDSITIPPLLEDQSYARNTDNSWQITRSPTPGFDNIITDIDYQITSKYQFKLEAYPNPFNPSTIISYGIAKPMDIKITIFDILGREVWSTERVRKEIGNYSIKWDGVDQQGMDLASGIYIAQIIGESFSKSLKLMLLR